MALPSIKIGQNAQSNIDRLVSASAKRRGKKIEERALRLMLHIAWHVVSFRLDDKAGETFAHVEAQLIVQPPSTGNTAPVMP